MEKQNKDRLIDSSSTNPFDNPSPQELGNKPHLQDTRNNAICRDRNTASDDEDRAAPASHDAKEQDCKWEPLSIGFGQWLECCSNIRDAPNLIARLQLASINHLSELGGDGLAY
jgi:hypothetical protein